MALEFIPGKTYVDREGNKFTFVHTFSNERYNAYNCCFEDESGRAAFRSEDGRAFTGGAHSALDIVAEYKEPRYAYFRVYQGDLQIIRRGSQYPTLEAVPAFSSTRHKILKVNIDTGESSYVTSD